jgi:hypothetical protein
MREAKEAYEKLTRLKYTGWSIVFLDEVTFSAKS